MKRVQNRIKFCKRCQKEFKPKLTTSTFCGERCSYFEKLKRQSKNYFMEKERKFEEQKKISLIKEGVSAMEMLQATISGNQKVFSSIKNLNKKDNLEFLESLTKVIAGEKRLLKMIAQHIQE